MFFSKIMTRDDCKKPRNWGRHWFDTLFFKNMFF